MTQPKQCIARSQGTINERCTYIQYRASWQTVRISGSSALTFPLCSPQRDPISSPGNARPRVCCFGHTIHNQAYDFSFLQTPHSSPTRASSISGPQSNEHRQNEWHRRPETDTLIKQITQDDHTVQPGITDFASHYDLLNYMTWLLTVT